MHTSGVIAVHPNSPLKQSSLVSSHLIGGSTGFLIMTPFPRPVIRCTEIFLCSCMRYCHPKRTRTRMCLSPLVGGPVGTILRGRIQLCTAVKSNHSSFLFSVEAPATYCSHLSRTHGLQVRAPSSSILQVTGTYVQLAVPIEGEEGLHREPPHATAQVPLQLSSDSESVTQISIHVLPRLEWTDYIRADREFVSRSTQSAFY